MIDRIDIKELYTVTSLFMQQYGSDYVLKCAKNTDDCVAARVTSKVEYEAPSTELVNQYLSVIAESYNVPWKEQESDRKERADEVRMHFCTEIFATQQSDIVVWRWNTQETSTLPSLARQDHLKDLPNTPPLTPDQQNKTVSIQSRLLPDTVSQMKSNDQNPGSSSASKALGSGILLTKAQEEADFAVSL